MSCNWRTQIFQSRAIHTQLDTFTAEASLIAGNNLQPTIPANSLALYGNEKVRFKIQAKGWVSSTGTPTYTFSLRANTTVGTANLAGDLIGTSVAITTASGITARPWFLEHDIVLLTPAQGDNASIQCIGSIRSPQGFASPFEYGLSPTSDTFTACTATIDLSVAHYINLSVACSASSGSNAIRCMDLAMWLETGP